MKRVVLVLVLFLSFSTQSYALFGEDGFLSGMATLIAKWGSGALDVMGKVVVGDLNGAGKKIDSLMKNEEEREEKKIELLQSIGTTLELQKKENEGWFKYIGRKYDEGKDVAKETLQAINDFERTKQKWQEYSQRSSQWLESFLNGDLPPEDYLSTFANLEDIFTSMTKEEKQAVNNKIIGQEADINFGQATNQDLDEVAKTLDEYGLDASNELEEIKQLKDSRDQMTISIASLNVEITDLNNQKMKLVEKVNELRTIRNGQPIMIGQDRVTIDPVQKEQIISSLKVQIANCDQLIKMRHDEMESKRLKLSNSNSKIKSKEMSIKSNLEALSMKMLTEIIGQKTRLKWANTLDQATLLMMQQQVADEVSGIFSMRTKDWNKKYLTKGLLLGQVNHQNLKVDVKEVVGTQTYKNLKSNKLKDLLAGFKSIEQHATSEIKKTISKTFMGFWMKKGKKDD